MVVIYTKWRNLKKTKQMEAGAVSFHDKAKVRKVDVEKNNAIVNALNRTKREEFPDLAAEQEARAAVFRREQKRAKQVRPAEVFNLLLSSSVNTLLLF